MEEDKPLTKKQKRALAKEQKRMEREKSETMGQVKKWGIVIIVIGVIVLLGAKFWKFANTTPADVPEQPLELTDSEWIIGAENAQATMVEYGDYQCPACKTYAPVVKQLLDEYPNDLRVIYRHIPLVSIHENAMSAARAAEAAGLQGKFWEMHDLLFEFQDDWATAGNLKEIFTEYATDLELDTDRFLIDFESDAVQVEVDKDIFSANRLGVNQTPTFYVNGKLVANPRGLESLKSAIDTALEED